MSIKTNLRELSGTRGRRALEKEHRQKEKGVKGRCVLRSLSCFDVGRSFLIDSLHNIYLGLFVSVDCSPRYKRSICTCIEKNDTPLAQLR